MKKLALMLTAVILVICTVAWLASFIAPKSSRTAEQFPAGRGAAEYPPAAPSEVPGGGAATPRLQSTGDPDTYAQLVAAAVLGMDTRVHDPADYRLLLQSEADPQMSAKGIADLDRMITERIPADELWTRMRSNDQWSQWRTTDVWQPGSWDQVVTSGMAEPGWALRNVLGMQTTHYLDAGEPRTTSRERTLTVGMRCPAPGAEVDRCHLALIGITAVS